MGRVLFLDDMIDRHREFVKATLGRGHDIVQAWTAAEAIKKLDSEKFDQVFLDHDLSEDDIMIKVGAKSKVRTGMDVVDHIMKMEVPPPEVIVHSCNGPAALQMAYRLSEHPAKIVVKRLAFPELLRAIYHSAV
jgi:hypothetical protein